MTSTHLPREIWEQCWSHLQLQELHNLTLVCSLFRDIGQPLLFHALKASDTSNFISTPTTHLHTLTRLEGFRVNPHLAGLVRQWNFELSNPAKLRDATLARIQQQVITSWRLTHSVFQNLSSLSLMHYELLGDDCRQLSRLEYLHALKLVECSIRDRGGAVLRHLRTFELTTEVPAFSYSTVSHCDDVFDLISGENLQEVRLTDPTVFISFATHFADQGLPCLFKAALCLTQTRESYSMLFSLLRRCPQLEDLAIDYPVPTSEHNFPDGPLPSLPSSYIPKLTRYDGPGYLVPHLLQNGRSVRGLSVGVNFSHTWLTADAMDSLVAALKAARVGSKDLVSLELPPLTVTVGSQILGMVDRWFPGLKELKFAVFDCRCEGSEQPEIVHAEESGGEQLPPTEQSIREEVQTFHPLCRHGQNCDDNIQEPLLASLITGELPFSNSLESLVIFRMACTEVPRRLTPLLESSSTYLDVITSLKRKCQNLDRVLLLRTEF